MNKYHYYTDGVNEDLVYELQMYADGGIKMPTSIFNAMLGRSTMGKVSQMKLERIDEEDVILMKRYGLIPTRIPYPEILSKKIKNGSYVLGENDILVIS